MKDYIEDRVIEIANYIIDNNSTVRAAAKVFHVSKSTVHKDLQERLLRVNRDLYKQCKRILDKNKAERHIRGGLATRKKYLSKHS
ncbi:MAG: sporulation transcriptional regulator SpoIIID [Clostridia bacterium]|nr:sporulation transcriptional regulator SpoIIID [Clostridia bacterium]